MKKKKKRQRYCPKEKREEKKMWRLDETHVQVHMSIFVNQEKMYTPPSFFPILGRKHFGGGPGEKTLGPHHFFPSPPSNQTPIKMFSFLFSLSLSLSLLWKYYFRLYIFISFPFSSLLFNFTAFSS